MECRHERLRCTNNVYYCLSCGAVVPFDPVLDKREGEKEKPAEAPKKPAKRKPKIKAD